MAKEKTECPHSIDEKVQARIAGACPLCLQAKVEQLKERINKAHGILNSWGRNKSDSLIYKTLVTLWP